MAQMSWQEWVDAMQQAAESEEWERLVKLMAANVGDKGDIMSLIEGFTANADPM